MNKVKSVLKLIKNWIVGNGIEGAAGLGVGVGLWIFGLKIWAGVCFGDGSHGHDLAFAQSRGARAEWERCVWGHISSVRQRVQAVRA